MLHVNELHECICNGTFSGSGEYEDSIRVDFFRGDIDIFLIPSLPFACNGQPSSMHGIAE
jgi:hypothetical protein